MKAIGFITTGLLFAAVTAQGAYIMKTRRQVAALSAEVERLSSEREDVASLPEARPWSPPPVATRPLAVPTPAGERPGLPPPKFVPPPSATVAAALPAALENPEAREQLRQIIAGELVREREQRRERERARRDEEQAGRDEARAEALVKGLGLAGVEAERFKEIFRTAQNARQDMREKVERGEAGREDAVRQFQALRKTTEDQMRQLLGDERTAKALEIERQQRRQEWGRGPGGAGRGPGGARPSGVPSPSVP